MKVEFIFHNKGNKFDVGEVETYLEELIKPPRQIQPFSAEVVSITITNMGRYLVILMDFPTLTKHERTLHSMEENWWEALAGYIVLRYDVVFLNWEVHGEDQSLLYKKDWKSGRRH